MLDLFMILVYFGLACIGFMVLLQVLVFMLGIAVTILTEISNALGNK